MPPIPEGVIEIRWRIQGFPGNDIYPRTSDVNITTFSLIVDGLSVNTSYSVRVRTDVKYPFCNAFLYGAFSREVTIRTAEHGKETVGGSIQSIPWDPQNWLL